MRNGRTVCIVQARMGSTRLPGKVLRPLLGKPMLGHQLSRLARCQQIDELVVATSESPDDNAIARIVEDVLALRCYRGSEEDVLARYVKAAEGERADIIVRVTGDCPLIEPEVVDLAVKLFKADNSSADYLSNTLERTYPRGLDVEVFSMAALREAHESSSRPEDREHVTPFLYQNRSRFRVNQFKATNDLSHLRWTVDTQADLNLVTRVYEALYPTNPQFNHQDVLKLLERSPQLASINAHVEQKTLSD